MDAKEVTNRLGLTVRVVDRIVSDTILSHVQRVVGYAFADTMISKGLRSSGIEVQTVYDPVLRAWEIMALSDVENDDRLVALVARMSRACNALTAALVAVNHLSLWKILWLRLRRLPLIAWSEDYD